MHLICYKNIPSKTSKLKDDLDSEEHGREVKDTVLLANINPCQALPIRQGVTSIPPLSDFFCPLHSLMGPCMDTASLQMYSSWVHFKESRTISNPYLPVKILNQ